MSWLYKILLQLAIPFHLLDIVQNTVCIPWSDNAFFSLTSFNKLWIRGCPICGIIEKLEAQSKIFDVAIALMKWIAYLIIYQRLDIIFHILVFPDSISVFQELCSDKICKMTLLSSWLNLLVFHIVKTKESKYGCLDHV